MSIISHYPGRLAIASILGTAAILSACSTANNSGSVYTPTQAQHEQTVRMGVVESVRQVTIKKEQSGVGTLGGGAIGAIAGSSLGGGRGAAVTGVLGAIGGGMAGNAIEDKVNSTAGVEITVKFDNGDMRAITQTADEPFRPGERVRILSGGGVTRVSH